MVKGSCMVTVVTRNTWRCIYYRLVKKVFKEQQ